MEDTAKQNPRGYIHDPQGYDDKHVIFRGANKDWYFRRVARNGEILCNSEGYKNFSHCFKMVQRLCRGANMDLLEVED